mmetsp:Transcript_15767/g.15916  ORF Transcript_15767/g.15916 Transcript_15767/m.15916 type:complete len:231 (+) Transcript_15767:112-804(+)
MNKVIVVRHGERLDEVDAGLWEKMCSSQLSDRNMFSLINDPPLTDPNGIAMATEAAQSIASIFHARNIVIDKIYASRLSRAYQTAYPIAQKLNLPIYISSKLALTAVAVGRSKGTYEFDTMDVIRSFCSGVSIIDADMEDDIPQSLEWSDSINYITSKERYSLIIAHRETIRNMAEQFVRTPYCCIAMFSKISADHFQLDEIFHRDASPIIFPEPVPPLSKHESQERDRK